MKKVLNNTAKAINTGVTVAKNLQEVRVVTNQPTKRELYQTKLVEAKEAREALRLEITSNLGTKKVTKKDGTTKVVNPSKSYVNQLATIEELYDAENRTLSETKRLINAISKVDDSNASQLYKYIKSVLNGTLDSDKNGMLNALAIELQGSNSVPTFNAFKESLPIKFAFSKSDAFNVLASFNKSKQLETKIAKQNAKTAQK